MREEFLYQPGMGEAVDNRIMKLTQFEFSDFAREQKKTEQAIAPEKQASDVMGVRWFVLRDEKS